MSAGPFINSKYEANSGSVYKVRVQPETLNLTLESTANSPPGGDVDQPISAYARGKSRGIGMHA